MSLFCVSHLVGVVLRLGYKTLHKNTGSGSNFRTTLTLTLDDDKKTTFKFCRGAALPASVSQHLLQTHDIRSFEAGEPQIRLLQTYRSGYMWAHHCQGSCTARLPNPSLCECWLHSIHTCRNVTCNVLFCWYSSSSCKRLVYHHLTRPPTDPTLMCTSSLHLCLTRERDEQPTTRFCR